MEPSTRDKISTTDATCVVLNLEEPCACFPSRCSEILVVLTILRMGQSVSNILFSKEEIQVLLRKY